MADPKVLRVGNCSGFYGDRLSAMHEMLEGGPLDVLTGDYLAELTMLILGKDTLKDPSLGYARTFVRQLEDCLGLALERGVRIVSNAGGLNPSGLAARVRDIAAALGLDVRVAHVEGDDLRPIAAELGLAGALTANAYLGGFGIAAALRGGADVVVTGRVSDASLVVGPAVAHFGWPPTAYDALAGATVAGHVLECGAHATGGNFSGFLDLPLDALERGRPLGFPLAELSADGSSVITKHPGTGGAVTVDTVSAQLFYEIQGPVYAGPDVSTQLESVSVRQVGEDRVALTGVRGGPPPATLKVGATVLGGYRNSVELVLTGLDLDAKAAWVRAQLEAAWGDRASADVTWSRSPLPVPDADTEEGASCLLRCTVRDPSPDVAGKGLTAPVVELALASYPGFTMTAPPAPASPYGVFRTASVARSRVAHTVVHADGRREPVPEAALADEAAPRPAALPPSVAGGPVRRVPLGTFVHARSGDKGGDANLGLWVRHDDDPRHDRRVAWLLSVVTPTWLRALLPEAAGLAVDVHPLPNLGGVNVVVHGLLGEGVAASTRFDPQAKALGEWARSRLVDVPEELL